MKRYGKSNAGYIDLSQTMFDEEENKRLMAEKARILDVYHQQPRRTQCKVCDDTLPERDAPHPIGYLICDQCGHANGPRDDTEAYQRAYYGVGAGEDAAAKHYSAEDEAEYRNRVTEIYRPKVDFLFDVIRDNGDDPLEQSYAEFGAGAGYFLAALLDAGAKGVVGYEVSQSQVGLGHSIFDPKHLICTGFEELIPNLENCEASVVSMIFTLEHIQAHRECLAAIANNPNIRHFFFAVPHLGVSTYLELAMPTVLARNSAGHSHLYTSSSIDWICKEFGFNRTGEWWFGGDAADILRSIALRIEQLHADGQTVSRWTDMFRHLVDPLQLAIDEKCQSSEIHVVLSKSV